MKGLEKQRTPPHSPPAIMYPFHLDSGIVRLRLDMKNWRSKDFRGFGWWLIWVRGVSCHVGIKYVFESSGWKRKMGSVFIFIYLNVVEPFFAFPIGQRLADETVHMFLYVPPRKTPKTKNK